MTATPAPAPVPVQKRPALRRDPSDPLWRAVELAQRGRMILDVSALDLAAAEEALGPFHPTAWHFRHALNEAKRAWDRLRAVYGGATLEAALDEPPVAVLTLGGDSTGLPEAVLVPIAGQTYRVARLPGTPPAPVQWRLVRLLPPHDDGPYHACRLEDDSTQCDCAEWTYQIADLQPGAFCKHLEALAALGWI